MDRRRRHRRGRQQLIVVPAPITTAASDQLQPSRSQGSGIILPISSLYPLECYIARPTLLLLLQLQ